MENEKIGKWELDDVLLTLHARDEDIEITIGQSCEGIMVMGASGSGKTSGPLNTIQLAQMKSGFGMLNLCVKKGFFWVFSGVFFGSCELVQDASPLLAQAPWCFLTRRLRRYGFEGSTISTKDPQSKHLWGFGGNHAALSISRIPLKTQKNLRVAIRASHGASRVREALNQRRSLTVR